MSAFAYLRSAPALTLCHWHSLMIGDLAKRRSTGKTIARVAHGDAQGDDFATSAVCL